MDVQVIQGGAANVGWINATGEEIADDGFSQTLREVSFAVQSWVQEARSVSGNSGLFDRRGFTVGDNPYEQMEKAHKAVREDDIVGGVADVTESLIFQIVKWEAVDPDVADVFNQWAAHVNMDDFLRQVYRDLYTYSICYVATDWTQQSYTPRNTAFDTEGAMSDAGMQIGEAMKQQVTMQGELLTPPGAPGAPGAADSSARQKRRRRRRKVYTAYMPDSMQLLDPKKIVPVGNTIFGQQQYAWIATKAEAAAYDDVTNGVAYDPTMSSLIVGRYTPSNDEKQILGHLQVDTNNLLLLNPERVWAHHRTKPGYQRFPDVRLTGVFKLLDLKQQLMAADRVNLVGAANYILLVKKGDKDKPGTPAEVDNLKENFKVLAKLPVIVSDHRLEIQIITPDVDLTLKADKYDTLDRRILGKALGTLAVASSGQRNETSVTVAKMVARLLESQRWMIRRAFEANVARKVLELNKDVFAGEPNLVFTPSRVELETQSEVLTLAKALNGQGDVSRKSILELIGMDEDVELQRKIEARLSGADLIFDTRVPFNSPDNQSGSTDPAQQGVNGRQGGRPPGTPDGAGKESKP